MSILDPRNQEPLDITKCVRNLRDVRLFQDLSEEQLASIAGLCELVIKVRGDFIAREGAPAESVYILLTGEVTIAKQLRLPQVTQARLEDRVLTRLSSEGRPPLGETLLVGQTVRTTTIKCASGCVLYKLNAQRLRALLLAEPVIGLPVYRRLSELLHERLQSSNTDVVKLSAALVYALED